MNSRSPGYSAAAIPPSLARPGVQLGKYVSGPGSANVTPIRRLGGMRRVGNIGTSFGF